MEISNALINFDPGTHTRRSRAPEPDSRPQEPLSSRKTRTPKINLDHRLIEQHWNRNSGVRLARQSGDILSQRAAQAVHLYTELANSQETEQLSLVFGIDLYA